MVPPASNEIDISVPSEFNVFVNASTMYLWDMIDEKIEFKKAKKTVGLKEYEKYRDHMKHLHKDIFSSPQKEPKDSSKTSCTDTITFFKSTQNKKKLFCRMGNSYLVKKGFTEGVQHVKGGEQHIYNVIGRYLDIYISNTPLDPKSFRGIYNKCTRLERISSKIQKTISSNTYYFVIAPCHAFFRKIRVSTSGVENSIEISASIPAEVQSQTTNVAEDRSPSSEPPSDTEGFYTFSEPSGSKDLVQGSNNSRQLMEIERNSENGIVNGGGSRDVLCESNKQSKRADSSSPMTRPSTSRMEVALVPPSANTSRDEMALDSVNEFELVNDSVRSYESDRQSKRVKYSLPLPGTSASQMEVGLVPQSPNSLRDEMERITGFQAINCTSTDDHCRAVFAIRKESSIESYALRSDSTFRVHDNILTGSFAIENDDMDPNVIEYQGDVQYIREVAKFKNGSTFETTLTVQKDLLDILRNSPRKEKVVVNYFFDFAFKAIEAAYKKFCDMRYTKMIGSCIPAIVPMSNAKFCGAVSEMYEAKP